MVGNVAFCLLRSKFCMSCKTSRNFGKDLERSFAYSDSSKNHEEQVISLDRTRFVRFEDGAELAAVIREVMYEGDKCTSLFDVQ